MIFVPNREDGVNRRWKTVILFPVFRSMPVHLKFQRGMTID